jgi:hypothetical protein
LLSRNLRITFSSNPSPMTTSLLSSTSFAKGTQSAYPRTMSTRCGHCPIRTSAFARSMGPKRPPASLLNNFRGPKTRYPLHPERTSRKMTLLNTIDFLPWITHQAAFCSTLCRIMNNYDVNCLLKVELSFVEIISKKTQCEL